MDIMVKFGRNLLRFDDKNLTASATTSVTHLRMKYGISKREQFLRNEDD